MSVMDGQKICGNHIMFNVHALKNIIERYNQNFVSRLKIFLTEYEKEKAIIFSKIINQYDFIKSKDVTLVASGLPFYMFDVLDRGFDYTNKHLYKMKKEVNKKEDGLFEIKFIEDSKESVERHDSVNIKLIDYSPLIKSTYHILKDVFKNVTFDFYDKNVNFDDIRNITKDSLVIIPYSEYLYTLKELEIFNEGQYVLVFNQKDDDERRKINTVFCIEDLEEQCGFSEIIHTQKYDICGIRMYAILGKI